MEILSLKFLFGVLSYVFLVEGVDRNIKWLKQDHLEGMLPMAKMRNITELTTKSLIQCLDKCTSTNSCVSAFYDKNATQKKCYLHDHIRTNTRLMTSNPNAVYYVRDDVYLECPSEDYKTQYTTVKLGDGKLFTFRIRDTNLEYDMAVKQCENDSASLVLVSTAALHEWLADNLRRCLDPSKTLIDASNQSAEDFFNITQWISSDGLAFNATYWEASEPSSPDGRHCIRAENDYRIRTHDCTNDERFMCEM